MSNDEKQRADGPWFEFYDVDSCGPCPGYHAVGGEPCAKDCIDAEMARDREEFDGECFEDDQP